MTASVLILLLGLLMVTFGADFLVDGASSIARKAGVSDFVIGVLIVGFGTSCPELVVSLTGAFGGSSAVAIGNVLGSNIFNTLLILSLTCIIFPIPITGQCRRFDIPFLLCVTAGFVSCILLGGISRLAGLAYLAVFSLYLLRTFKNGAPETASEGEPEKRISLPLAILACVAGLAMLVGGGRLFVDSAVDIARALGVSEKFIAVTILACGTSLPELVTCVVAAFKKKAQLALGNIIGSNLFNILLILGLSSLVCPIDASSINAIDCTAIALSSILLFVAIFTGKNNRLDRFDGAVMLVAGIAYYIGLFIFA